MAGTTPAQVVYGINPVGVAIEHGFVRSLLYAEGTDNRRIIELVERATSTGIACEAVRGERLAQLAGPGAHQGVVAHIRKVPPVELGVVAKRAGPRSLVVLLDQVTDPQNVGAVVRTAAAVGCEAIVLSERRGAHLSPGVHRASAGLSLVAPVARPMNIARGVELLKDHGYWIVAAEQGEGSSDATGFDWPERTALVLGSEGRGVAQNVLGHSDFRVALPMAAGVESLNVGVAFGALAYLWRRQWPLVQTGVLDEHETS